MNQNNHIKVAMSFLIFFAIGIKDVGAEIITNSVTISPTSLLFYTGAANSIATGSVIGGNWSGTNHTTTIFSCANIGCTTATTYVIPRIPPYVGIGRARVNGVDYDIYPSGVPGIGYILGIKDPNATNYIAANYPSTQTFPAPGTPAAYQAVGAQMQVSFVTTGAPLVSGSYFIPSQTIASFNGVYLPSNQSESIPILISAVRVYVTSSGCKVSSANNLNIDMKPVLANDFPNIGSTVDGGSTNITLSCDNNVKVYEVMTDSTKPANRTDVLSLTSGSTAKGVGFQLIQEPSTTAIKYGPDSTQKGTTNQFFVSNITSNGQILNLPIKAQYIRTGNITAGSANAVATVTFSYQ